MGRHSTDPSNSPMFPPTAPSSLDEAPTAAGLLKSAALETGPFALCGANVLRKPGDQSLISVTSGKSGESLSVWGETKPAKIP